MNAMAPVLSAERRPHPAVGIGGPVAALLDGQAGEAAFRAMHAAFRATGGMLCVKDLARLLADHHLCEGNPTLDATLDDGTLFALPWRGTWWVPMVQFDLADMRLRTSVGLVRRELSRDMDDWQVAAWFARPNDWLNGSRPVDHLVLHLPCTLNAARADRFVIS